MSKQATIYRRYDSDTTPRGFGNAPTYHCGKPYTSDSEMIWADEITITLPGGYEIAESADSEKHLYDAKGEYVQIDDDHGHPAILLDVYYSKTGKPYGHYLRLDK
jgi:hypothetical protein